MGGTKYNMVETIGKGAFATVYKMTTKIDGEVYAAKEITRRQFLKSNATDRRFDSEMTIMQELRHVRHIPPPLPPACADAVLAKYHPIHRACGGT